MRRISGIGIAVYLGLGAAVAAGAAACSDDANQVAPVSLDSVTPPPSVVATDAASTTAPPTTLADTATTVAATSTSAPLTTAVPTTTSGGLTGPMFSDALGVKVDTAPGVRTRGDTRRLLDEGVFVHIAWEPDPTDASVFTVQPDDIPILEAYAMAQATYYRAALGLTTTDDPAFDRYIVGGGERFKKALAKRAEQGKVLAIGTGVTLRPYVLGDQRTENSAVVLDCLLEDEQELPIGTQATPSDLRTYNLVISMIREDGVWKVERSGEQEGVCL